MAAESAILSPNAITRSADDEQEDLEAAIRNAVDGAYLNWPNEAGVSATPLIFLDTGLDHKFFRDQS